MNNFGNIGSLLKEIISIEVAEQFYSIYMDALLSNLLSEIDSKLLLKVLDKVEKQMHEHVVNRYNTDKSDFKLPLETLLKMHNKMMKTTREAILKEYIEK